MTISKRAAILAVFSGIISKMAHADDPNWKATPNIGSMYLLQSGPTVWTVNLDQMKYLDVMFDGNRITIYPIEIMDALRGAP